MSCMYLASTFLLIHRSAFGRSRYICFSLNLFQRMPPVQHCYSIWIGRIAVLYRRITQPNWVLELLPLVLATLKPTWTLHGLRIGGAATSTCVRCMATWMCSITCSILFYSTWDQHVWLHLVKGTVGPTWHFVKQVIHQGKAESCTGGTKCQSCCSTLSWDRRCSHDSSVYSDRHTAR